VFAPTGGRPDVALMADDGTVETGRVLTHGPASRAVNRRPAVSGAPPWEPAAPPKSELPWTASPSAEPGPGWAAPDRQRGLPAPPAASAGEASPGVAAFFRPAEPPDSGSGSIFGPAEPATDSLFWSGVEPGRHQSASGPRQIWQSDEIIRPSAAERPGESWAGHSSPHRVVDAGGPWHGSEAVRAWSDPGESQIHDQPGEPWAERGGEYQAGHAAGFSWSDALPGESSGRSEVPAESWRADSWQASQPVESRGGYQPSESWSEEQPRQTWSREQSGESWRGHQPTEAWSGERRPGGLWNAGSSSADDGTGLPADSADTSLAWSTGDPQQSFGGPLPARPGQHRLAPSGLPVRQPRATQQAAPLSPSGSLWERPGRGGSLWERAENRPAEDE
jgi:hypothetical protein